MPDPLRPPVPEQVPILGIVLFLGYLSHNHLIVLAAGFLLLVVLLNGTQWLAILDQQGATLGFCLLMASLLATFLTDEMGWESLLSLPSIIGPVSLAAGVAASLLCARGMRALSDIPHLVLPIIFGSLLSLLYFHGVPTGPFIAAGVAVLLSKTPEL